MLLNDEEIFRRSHPKYAKEPMIEPYDALQGQPNSYDVRLAPKILYLNRLEEFPKPVNPLKPDLIHWGRMDLEDRALTMNPGEFLLGVTIEVVRIPADVVGRVDGKSTLGRCGLLVHATAGLLDSGFHGRVTLELKNLLDRPLILTPGMLIAQLTFERTRVPEATYQGRYQDSLSDWPVPPMAK